MEGHGISEPRPRPGGHEPGRHRCRDVALRWCAILRHPNGAYAINAAIGRFFEENTLDDAARLHSVEVREHRAIAELEVESESDVTTSRQCLVDVFRLDEQGRIIYGGVYSGNIVPGSDETAKLAVFFASELSNAVTGHLLDASAGQWK